MKNDLTNGQEFSELYLREVLKNANNPDSFDWEIKIKKDSNYFQNYKDRIDMFINTDSDRKTGREFSMSKIRSNNNSITFQNSEIKKPQGIGMDKIITTENFMLSDLDENINNIDKSPAPQNKIKQKQNMIFNTKQSNGRSDNTFKINYNNMMKKLEYENKQKKKNKSPKKNNNTLLKDFYNKYSQNVESYLTKNKHKPMKFVGNKLYKKTPVEQYLKNMNRKHNENLNSLNRNDSGSNGLLVSTDNDSICLTPLPMKPRSTIKTELEYEEVYKSERSAVMMRIVEYTSRNKFIRIIREMYKKDPRVVRAIEVIQKKWRLIMYKKDACATYIQKVLRSYLFRLRLVRILMRNEQLTKLVSRFTKLGLVSRHKKLFFDRLKAFYKMVKLSLKAVVIQKCIKGLILRKKYSIVKLLVNKLEPQVNRYIQKMTLNDKCYFMNKLKEVEKEKNMIISLIKIQYIIRSYLFRQKLLKIRERINNLKPLLLKTAEMIDTKYKKHTFAKCRNMIKLYKLCKLQRNIKHFLSKIQKPVRKHIITDIKYSSKEHKATLHIREINRIKNAWREYNKKIHILVGTKHLLYPYNISKNVRNKLLFTHPIMVLQKRIRTFLNKSNTLTTINLKKRIISSCFTKPCQYNILPLIIYIQKKFKAYTKMINFKKAQKQITSAKYLLPSISYTKKSYSSVYFKYIIQLQKIMRKFIGLNKLRQIIRQKSILPSRIFTKKITSNNNYDAIRKIITIQKRIKGVFTRSSLESMKNDIIYRTNNNISLSNNKLVYITKLNKNMFHIGNAIRIQNRYRIYKKNKNIKNKVKQILKPSVLTKYSYDTQSNNVLDRISFIQKLWRKVKGENTNTNLPILRGFVNRTFPPSYTKYIITKCGMNKIIYLQSKMRNCYGIKSKKEFIREENHFIPSKLEDVIFLTTQKHLETKLYKKITLLPIVYTRYIYSHKNLVKLIKLQGCIKEYTSRMKRSDNKIYTFYHPQNVYITKQRKINLTHKASTKIQKSYKNNKEDLPNAKQLVLPFIITKRVFNNSSIQNIIQIQKIYRTKQNSHKEIRRINKPKSVYLTKLAKCNQISRINSIKSFLSLSYLKSKSRKALLEVIKHRELNNNNNIFKHWKEITKNLALNQQLTREFLNQIFTQSNSSKYKTPLKTLLIKYNKNHLAKYFYIWNKNTKLVTKYIQIINENINVIFNTIDRALLRSRRVFINNLQETKTSTINQCDRNIELSYYPIHKHNIPNSSFYQKLIFEYFSSLIKRKTIKYKQESFSLIKAKSYIIKNEDNVIFTLGSNSNNSVDILEEYQHEQMIKVKNTRNTNKNIIVPVGNESSFNELSICNNDRICLNLITNSSYGSFDMPIERSVLSPRRSKIEINSHKEKNRLLNIKISQNETSDETEEGFDVFNKILKDKQNKKFYDLFNRSPPNELDSIIHDDSSIMEPVMNPRSILRKSHLNMNKDKICLRDANEHDMEKLLR